MNLKTSPLPALRATAGPTPSAPGRHVGTSLCACACAGGDGGSRHGVHTAVAHRHREAGGGQGAQAPAGGWGPGWDGGTGRAGEGNRAVKWAAVQDGAGSRGVPTGGVHGENACTRAAEGSPLFGPPAHVYAASPRPHPRSPAHRTKHMHPDTPLDQVAPRLPACRPAGRPNCLPACPSPPCRCPSWAPGSTPAGTTPPGRPRRRRRSRSFWRCPRWPACSSGALRGT